MLQTLALAAAPRGSDVFLGIDVSSKSWHVTARCLGETALSVNLPPSRSALSRVLDGLAGCRMHSVYEAGAFGYTLHDWLKEQGVDSIVASPAHIPVEVGNRIKTDRRDSLKLATTLEAGLLRPVFIPPMRQRADRELVRQRDRLQRHRRAAMIRLRAFFLTYAIACPYPAGRPWRGPLQRWLRDLKLEDESLQQVLDESRGLFFDLETRLRDLEKRLRAMAHAEPYAASTELLTSIPGIAEINALTLAVELGDLRRFQSGESLSAYLGLTPSEYSSGDKVRHGRITRCGNRLVRTLLVEASWVVIRKDERLRAVYQKLKRTRGAKRALVAVARRLCHCLVAMARTGELYRAQTT